MEVINTFLLLYLIWRFHLLESRRTTQPAARVIAPGLPEWQKPVEGFEPEPVQKVLPRSKEEKAAKVKTEWEINSHIKIR